MKLKQGVSLHGVQPEIMIAMQVADRCYTEEGLEMWVTSVCDGKHGRSSKHFVGYAFDSDGVDGRGSAASYKQLQRVADSLLGSLTAEFDVVFGGIHHKSHIHVEFDPKRQRRV